MERTPWADERLDDAFAQLREEVRDLRAEMRAGLADVRREIAQLRIFMFGGLVSILAAVIGLHG
jgi:hypothetical protein